MHRVIEDLKRLRMRSQAMLIAQRVSLMLALTLIALLACGGLDWLLRFPSGVRFVILIVGLAAVGHMVWHWIRPAIRFRPTLTQLALRAEESIPGVSGRLASSVEFVTAGLDNDNALAARSVRDTEARLAGTSLDTIVRTGPTFRQLGLFLVTVATLAIVVAVSPAAARTGASRLLLPFGDATWPARTRVRSLMSDVLTPAGVHPRGQVLPLRARNMTPDAIDDDVEATYRLIGGADPSWKTIVLTHQGDGIHERLVDTNGDAIEVRFTTSDNQTDLERIELVAPPAIHRATIEVTPPAYASGRYPMLDADLGPGLDERATTERPSLVGSQVSVTFELNKPLPAGRNDDEWISRTFGVSGASFKEEHAAAWTLRWRLEETTNLAVTLEDEYGLTNAEPIAYRITAIADRAPGVSITSPQSDESVLPTAVIDLAAEANDDVALSRVSLEAVVERAAEPGGDGAPAWTASEDVDTADSTLQTPLDLGALDVVDGDLVLVTATASDAYELDGMTHEPARSAVRRLRVIDELELAEQLRRQLGAVRQHAIRIEGQQAELQDDIIDDGVQPGVDRAQAMIGERIAAQQEALAELAERMQRNRLDDDQLDTLLRQAQDLLDYAGRSVNQAVDAIQQQPQPSGGARAAARGGERQPADGAPRDPDEGDDRPRENDPAAADDEADPTDADAAARDDEDESLEDLDLREPAESDREIVDAQQEVRDELGDLIELLDRDEDTWVVTRQLENLLGQQAQLEADTRTLGEQTIGREVGDLSEQELTELDRIARRQQELADEAQRLIEEMRNRARALDEADPQSAAGMRSAADTAEQRELDRDMQRAADRAQRNQMRSAASRQQAARQTLQRMLEDMKETKRAQAEELIRQLASLVESIDRLINVQEGELVALARAIDSGEFNGRDRAMIRLNQNTQAVAAEARAAGQDARRIARALDRAADAQGAAVGALRHDPVDVEEAVAGEERSLELLKEAKDLAEALREETEADEVQRRREELLDAYREMAERQVTIRGETQPLIEVDELDRRQLVEARRLGTRQDDLRLALDELRGATAEVADSRVFSHVHDMIDRWSLEASDALQEGRVTSRVTDRQGLIADSIGRLISALEDLLSPPEEFENDQGGGQGQGQGGESGQQPLIPPITELRLLRGVQEQIYDRTKAIDEAGDAESPERREDLRELGRQQRDILDLGREMAEQLQQGGGAPPSTPVPVEDPGDTLDPGEGDSE